MCSTAFHLLTRVLPQSLIDAQALQALQMKEQLRDTKAKLMLQKQHDNGLHLLLSRAMARFDATKDALVLAEEAQAIADEYRDDGVRYLTVMPQDVEGDIPDQDFLAEWGESFELAEPILQDAEGYTYQVVTGGRGFPAVLVIDADSVVTEDILEVSDAGIRAAIETAL